MSTMTDNPEDDGFPEARHNAEIVTMPRCSRCSLSYLPSKSTSALRLTYCSFLCELGDLGFSIVGLEHMELQKKAATPDPEPEPLAID